jgi:hypothetical protein
MQNSRTGRHSAYHNIWCERKHQTTILRPAPRPGGRLGSSSRRHSAGRTNSFNHRYFYREIVSNNDTNVFSNNVSNNFASNARCSDGLRLRFRLRCSAGFSYRRSRRRKRVRSSRHVYRYFATNNVRYFERHNCAFGRRQRLRENRGQSTATIPHITPQPAVDVIPQVIGETASPVVSHIATRILSPPASRAPRPVIRPPLAAALTSPQQPLPYP